MKPFSICFSRKARCHGTFELTASFAFPSRLAPRHSTPFCQEWLLNDQSQLFARSKARRGTRRKIELFKLIGLCACTFITRSCVIRRYCLLLVISGEECNGASRAFMSATDPSAWPTETETVKSCSPYFRATRLGR